MLLKEAKVDAYIKEEIKLEGNKAYPVWGQMMPKATDHLINGVFSSLQVQYNVLSIIAESLVIIPINNVTGKMIEQEHYIIPLEDIRNVEISPKLLSYQICFYLDDHYITFKVNKYMIGAKWHKENMPHFLEKVQGI